MATIVTVHGTFASGPLEGQKWWQRGSGFASDLPKLIEGADGELVIEPFVWTGLNSEAGRRRAGEQLAAKLVEVEAAGKPYAVIAHSHGGSVLGAALLNAARDRQSLPLMQRWITVGTPFIKTERQRFLFSRLGILGKAIYLTLLTFLFLGILIAMGGSVSDEPAAWIMLLATFIAPIALFYAVLRYKESRRSLAFNSRYRSFAGTHFADRWLSLWHAKDEAVQCLRAVKRVDVSIFPRHFAASALSLFSIGIIPLACLWALNSQSIMNVIAGQVFSVIDRDNFIDLYPSAGANIFENAAVLFLGLLVIPANLLYPGGELVTAPLPVQFALVGLGIALLVGAAYVLTLTFDGIAKLVSHGLSTILNPLTLAQIKAATYGSDTLEDSAIDTSEWPLWLTHGFPPLPAGIADGIETASDRAIGTAIPKFRNVVDSLIAADTSEATRDVIADYLTWRELIHTSYFEDENFVKLIAFALCQTDAFRPTENFASDPALTDVGHAYAAITHSAAKVAV
ncbi:hypothetical protein DLM45_05695 [Hyphomicrobium methylovorum]|uniref:hypothetical protein n=1 Tax=Hyphomicrobium methylovorum TaxID=84 RepID=UPI0015E74CDB|nr:hypothetical protein [Hyphomicrobium methylovorum]MBA2125717.1 hypothetical protein [Hyphomicrobium methylovorum]